MVVRSLLRLALAALVWLSPAGAGAAEATVEIERPAQSTCVSEEELRRALERSGLTVATAGSEPGERIRVSVEGTPGELTVVVRRAGAESSERLAPATCETATDVVAAFVVSAVAPAPVLPVEPPATAPAEKLDVGAFERAVRDELDHREVDYRKRGITLAFSRDATGRFLVHLDKSYSPECTRSLALGAFERLSDKELEKVTSRVIRAVRDRPTAGARGRSACGALCRQELSQRIPERSIRSRQRRARLERRARARRADAGGRRDRAISRALSERPARLAISARPRRRQSPAG